MITSHASFSGMSVNDLAKAREFYVDTLQLPVKSEEMGLTLELPGGGALYLYEKPDHQPATYTALNFVVEDIDKEVEHLAGHHGIAFERYEGLPAEQDEKNILRGKPTGDGPDIAWFRDPAGNILSVIEN